MFRAIWEFAQSRDCVAHSQNPEIAKFSDCAEHILVCYLFWTGELSCAFFNSHLGV